MTLFRNKFSVETTRLRGWDYGAPGTYYVTICTKNRAHFLGDIADRKMHLSEIGLQVEKEWLATPALRPDMNLTLRQYVVMPNHFHGIIIIGPNPYNTPALPLPAVPSAEHANQFGPNVKTCLRLLRGLRPPLPNMPASIKLILTGNRGIGTILFAATAIYAGWNIILNTMWKIGTRTVLTDNNL